MPISENNPTCPSSMVSHGLMFHHFHGEGYPQDFQGSLSATDFESILIQVGIKNILQPQEWLYRVTQNRLQPNDLCLTFDDGLKCQYDVALPILKKHALQAFWFVYSAPFEGKWGLLEPFRRFRCHYFQGIDEYYQCFQKECNLASEADITGNEYLIFQEDYRQKFPFYTENDIHYRYLRDRVLSPEQYRRIILSMIKSKGLSVEELGKGLWMNNELIRDMHSQGHIVGMHSYDHPTRMAALSKKEQQKQYQKNYNHLTKVCGKPTTMSHPCDSYNKVTIEILKELNISLGFRSNMSNSKSLSVSLSAFELSREDSANLSRNIPNGFSS